MDSGLFYRPHLHPSSCYGLLPSLRGKGSLRCVGAGVPSSPLRWLLVGTYKWQRPAQLGISPPPPALSPALEGGLGVDAEKLKLGRGRKEGRAAAGPPRAAPSPRRSVLPLGRLPPPSSSLHFPGISARCACTPTLLWVGKLPTAFRLHSFLAA